MNEIPCNFDIHNRCELRIMKKLRERHPKTNDECLTRVKFVLSKRTFVASGKMKALYQLKVKIKNKKLVKRIAVISIFLLGEQKAQSVP